MWPEVWPHAVAAGGVVSRPEKVYQLAVGDDCGIVDHLHDFYVRGSPHGDLLVGGVEFFAAGVAADGFVHAFEFFVKHLDAPEATRADDCGSHACGHFHAGGRLRFSGGLRGASTGKE